MLYLTYWVRYGYENLFLTHTNVRKTLTAEQPIDEKKFYEDFKDKKDQELIEALGLSQETFNDSEYYFTTFFKTAAEQAGLNPGMLQVGNIELHYESDDAEVILEEPITDEEVAAAEQAVEEVVEEAPKKKRGRKAKAE